MSMSGRGEGSSDETGVLLLLVNGESRVTERHPPL